jgi:hypothetical protein
VYRTGSAVVQSQIWVNTSNTLVGATRIATGANQSADGGWFRNERDFQIKSNVLYGYNFAQQIANDITFVSNTRDQVTIDPTVDLYIIFAVLLGDTSEQATINRVRITEHS